MINKKNILIIIVALFLFNNVYSQDYSKSDDSSSKEKSSFSSKLFTGGDFGLQFRTVTMINLSPLIGYKLDKKTSVGIGGIYEYYSDSRYGFYANIYGFRTFARYLIFENVFAHAEFEELNLPNLDTYFIGKSRLWLSNIYVGGGYRQLIGGNSYLNLLILWNINDSRLSSYSYSYSNPVIRVTFDIGL